MATIPKSKVKASARGTKQPVAPPLPPEPGAEPATPARRKAAYQRTADEPLPEWAANSSGHMFDLRQPETLVSGRNNADDDSEYHETVGAKFRQGPHGLYAWAPPKSEEAKPEEYEILPGHLAVTDVLQLRDLDPDRQPETILADTVFDVTYRPHGKDQDRDKLSVEVSAIDRDAREPVWPDALGVRPRTTKRRISKVGEAITAMAASLEDSAGWGYAYACSGPLRLPDGSLAFLRPGAAALTANGFDPTLLCRFPAGVGSQHGIRALTIDDPSGPDAATADLDAYMRILDLTPGQPEIALCLASLLAWAPFASLPGLGMASVVLAGETGSRKTAMGGVLIAAQSRAFVGGKGVETPVTVKMRGNQTTVFGSDQIMHPLSGFVALADDLFADQMTPREVADAWRRLSLIGDNVATGSGGTRGGYRNGARHIAASVYPRCCLLVTAERLPDESAHSSATARYAVLELGSPVSLPVLTEVQATSRAISRAHAAMIAAHLTTPAMLREALAAGQDITRAWGLDGHGRVESGYERLAAGAYLIGERLRTVYSVDPAPFMASAADLLRKAASDQTQRSGIRKGRDMARDPVRLFVKHLRAALADGSVWLAGEKMTGREYNAPDIPGHGPHSVGWRQTGGPLGGMVPARGGPPAGAVIISGPQSHGWPRGKTVARIRAAGWQAIYDDVAERVGREGWGLPAPDVMRSRLADAGYLASATDARLPLWDTNTRCLSLDLLQTLSSTDDDGPERGSPDSQDAPPRGPEPGQDTLDGLPSPDDSPAHSRAADPTPEPPGAVKPCPGPCRGCGDIYEYGRGGWLCPKCQAGQSNTPAGQSNTPAAPARKAARTEHGYAVLSPAGLHISGESQPAPLPSGLADAYRAAADRDIRQLWIHPAAAESIGLPGLDARPGDIRDGAGVPHQWAELPEGLSADPAGLAPWTVVWDTAAGRRESGRSIVLPHLEPRAYWAFDGDGEPWGATVDGPVMLEAITLLADALGAGCDYYSSPNATAAQMARRLCRSLVPCEAIASGQIPRLWSMRRCCPRNGRAG